MSHRSLRRLKQILLPALLVVAAIATPGQNQLDRQNIVKITLLHVNDVYQFTSVDQDKFGGLDRVMTIRKQVALESPNILFLMAGDTISPSVESITYKGAQMIEAWNVAGLDYAVFGNHEFDFGPDVLKQRMLESRFKWLGANVTEKPDEAGPGSEQPKVFGGGLAYDIRELSGVKIGILGLVLPETKVTSRPGSNVQFALPCDTAKRLIPEMRTRGAQVIIALTHLSMREDKELARCAPIDIIIGGHEHTLLQSLSGRTPIFKMDADAREVGRVDLNIDTATGRLASVDWRVIPVTNEIPGDPQFAAVTRKYEPILRELAKAVGRTSVPLDARSAPNRTRETNMGSFIADAFREGTGADVAIMNGGSIRADAVIPAGQLTRRDILSILPFANRLVKLRVTGETLLKAIEHGVSRSAEDAEPGMFPQISGMKFTYDASKAPGARVIELTINGQAVNLKGTYTVATTTFIGLDGGDGYNMFRGATLVEQPTLTDSEILSKAISSVPSIAPRVEGRIKRVDQ